MPARWRPPGAHCTADATPCPGMGPKIGVMAACRGWNPQEPCLTHRSRSRRSQLHVQYYNPWLPSPPALLHSRSSTPQSPLHPPARASHGRPREDAHPRVSPVAGGEVRATQGAGFFLATQGAHQQHHLKLLLQRGLATPAVSAWSGVIGAGLHGCPCPSLQAGRPGCEGVRLQLVPAPHGCACPAGDCKPPHAALLAAVQAA